MELGKAATARPWTTAPYRSHNGVSYIDRADVDYLAAAANSADIMAQELIDNRQHLLAIGKLCDGNGDVRKADVREILEGQ